MQGIIYLLFVMIHNLILSRQPPLFQGTAAVILLFFSGLPFEKAPLRFSGEVKRVIVCKIIAIVTFSAVISIRKLDYTRMPAGVFHLGAADGLNFVQFSS